MRNRYALAALVLAVSVPAGCGKTPREEAPVVAKTAPEAVATSTPTIGTPNQGVVAEFTRRVGDYVAIREQLAGTLKKPSDKATPKEIDAYQRALGALMAKARSDAKQGDIFLADMQTFVRGLVRRVLAEPDGARIRGSLMDENPMAAKVAVNGRYPDTVPLSTMPPDILSALPRLPEDLEFRFVGNRLILLDVQSHLIVDYVDNTFDV